MSGIFEKVKLCVDGQVPADCLAVGRRHPGVTVAVHQESGAMNAFGIFSRIVSETIEPQLPSAPKDQQVGQGEGGQFHSTKAVACGVQQAVERAFENQPVGLDIFPGHGPENGGSPQ